MAAAEDAEEDKAVQFLRERGVAEEALAQMKEQKIDSNTIPWIEDSELAKIIPKMGDRAAVRHYCRDSKDERESRRMTLFDKLREKMGIKPFQESSTGQSPSQIKNKLKMKTQQKRKVEFGWMHDGRIMWARFGGGTRTLRVDGGATRGALLQIAKDLYFPMGVSPQGKAEDFNLDILDYKQMTLSSEMTVDSLCESMHMGRVKFYLSSIKKVEEKNDSSQSKQKDKAAKSTNTSPVCAEAKSNVSPVDVHEIIVTSSSDDDIVQVRPLKRSVHFVSDDDDDDTLPLSNSSSLNLDDSDSPPPKNRDPDNRTKHQQSDLGGSPPPQALVAQSSAVMLQEQLPLRSDSNAETTYVTVKVHRVNILKEMMALFKSEDILQTHIKFSFVDEMGSDAEGVSREAFSEFWNYFLASCAEGEDVRVPALCPEFGFQEWQAVGRILVKGFCTHNVFPLQLAPAFFISLIFGEDAVTPNDLLESLFNFVSHNDREVLQNATTGLMTEDDKEVFLEILDREGFHALPPQDQVPYVLQQMAHKNLIQESSYAVEAMRPIVQAGLADKVRNVEDVRKMYTNLRPTAKKVCSILRANPANREQDQAFRYLLQFVRAQDDHGLAKLLHFLTASRVLSVDDINVEFTASSGIERRPIAHTCGPLLELPATYTSYRDFRNEWEAVLSSGYCRMDIA